MGVGSGSVKLIISIVIAIVIVAGSWFLTRDTSEGKSTLKHVTSDSEIISDSVDDSSDTGLKLDASSQDVTTTTKATTKSGKTTTKATTKATTQTTPAPTPSVASPAINYYSLNAQQRDVYNKLSNAINSGNPNVSINVAISQNDFKAIYCIAKDLNYYSANIPMSYNYQFYSQTGVITSATLKFPYSKAKGDAMTATLKSKVSSIKAGIPKTSDFEKVKYIHDYIINNCSYKSSAIGNSEACPTAFTAYGALVEGAAVCEGYSKAFSLLCHEVGIDSLLVTGTGSGQGHMWNMVKCNGQWYHMDVTWDDPITSTGKNSLLYNYFNITTTEIQKDHFIENSMLRVPSASATAANFYVHNGYFATSYTQAKSIVKAQADKGIRLIRLKAANLSIYNEIYSKMICSSGDIFRLVPSSKISYSPKGSSKNYEIDISY